MPVTAQNIRAGQEIHRASVEAVLFNAMNVTGIGVDTQHSSVARSAVAVARCPVPEVLRVPRG